MGDSGGLVETTRKAFVERAFGPEFIEALKNYGLTTRDLYELSSPTTQCVNVIGNCDPINCTCWLCGLPIYLDENGNRTQDKQNIGDRFTPECEHVLPVMQAVLVFGSLYSERGRREGGDWWNHINKFFPLEYRWSHSVCNNIKDENLFFDDKGVIQDYLIDNYLNKIYSKLKLPFEKREWLAKQKNYIITVLQPIVDYYNRRRATDGNLFLLSSVGVAVNDVINLPNILEEGNKLRTFMELWQPEIIPPYYRPFSNGRPIQIRTITVKEYIEYINLIPFNRIYDYMKGLSTERDEKRYLVANKYLQFYKSLFYSDSDKVSQISELDIKSAIMAHYFLDKQQINSLISEIIGIPEYNPNSAHPYIISLYYYIIHRKMLDRCEELKRAGIISDAAFILLINEELTTAYGILQRPDYLALTNFLWPKIFPPTGGYKKKRGRKQTRKRFRKARKTRRSQV